MRKYGINQAAHFQKTSSEQTVRCSSIWIVSHHAGTFVEYMQTNY